MSSNVSQTDTPSCGFLKLDKDRKILSCNQYGLDLLSYDSLGCVTGLCFSDLVSLASSIFIDSYTFPMLLAQGKAEEIQVSFKSVSGDTIPVVANAEMNADHTTTWTFMSCVNRNTLYNELLTARDTLQTQALSVSQLNDQIKERRQTDLEAFCHSLSHDFTGPLRRIHQMIDFALEDFEADGITASEPFKLLHNAKKNTTTLLEMTNSLVEYLVADVPVSHDEIVDLEEIIATVQAMRDQEDATVPTVDLSPVPKFSGSQGQIQVLFKNLIENAIKYNENDPVISISHTVDAVNDRLIIAIKDNGIGMKADYLGTIFTPFTRLNSASEYTGNGLGLSIVKKMVKSHNGDIYVKSTPGNGSTFFVSLPYIACSDA